MRILLVNAYGPSDEGRRKYREFREILLQVNDSVRSMTLKRACKIKQTVKGENDNLEWKEFELIERDKDHIDEYLFDLNTSYSKKDNAGNFDLLDLICVVGDVNLLPWQKSAEKVNLMPLHSLNSAFRH